MNALEIILFESKILKEDQPFQICYFSDNIGKISGYDRFDLFDHDFLQSRIHPDDQSESIFQPTHKSKWEKSFYFKKPDGNYAQTLASFLTTDEINLLGSWHFI